MAELYKAAAFLGVPANIAHIGGPPPPLDAKALDSGYDYCRAEADF